ncbi:hypothetical protein [Bremerella sp.]|uniref:hypothetical protein n=1 Tax=Bremerella sp. TaxID=2795602 RepID=UPI00391A42C4
MKPSFPITFTTLVFLSLASLTVAEEPSTVTHVEMVSLKIRICEATADGKPKVLAEPTIMTITGREIRFVSGGEMKSKFDETKHDLGTQISALIEPHQGGTYKLKLQSTLGNLKLPEQEPETELFIQQKLTARTIVEPGKTKKIAVSPGCWYEITVEKPTTQVGTALSGTVRYEELPPAPMGTAKPLSPSE